MADGIVHFTNLSLDGVGIHLGQLVVHDLHWYLWELVVLYQVAHDFPQVPGHHHGVP